MTEETLDKIGIVAMLFSVFCFGAATVLTVQNHYPETALQIDMVPQGLKDVLENKK